MRIVLVKNILHSALRNGLYLVSVLFCSGWLIPKGYDVTQCSKSTWRYILYGLFCIKESGLSTGVRQTAKIWLSEKYYF